jgi:DNA-binding LacI/PurR family transcriptional regulator
MPERKNARNSSLKPGPQRVGLKFIGEYLGLSPATISVVLNDSPAAKVIPEPTKRRIFEAAEKFNYRANFFARSLRHNRTYTVAVLMPEMSEGYTASIVAALEEEFVRDDYSYFITSHHHRSDLVDELPRKFMDRAEGLVLINTHLRHAPPMPAVVISGHADFPGVTNITIDNYKGGFLAVEHVAQFGHKRVAFLKGHKGSADTDDRWAGNLTGAAKYGIEVRPELTVQLGGEDWVTGPCTPQQGCEDTHKLLARNEPFTALVGFNDVAVIGAMRALREVGLRVPEDVSVIGFDDIDSAAYQNPSLTTVRQPLREMGRLAAKTLLEKISRNDDTPRTIRLEPELIVRESTAPLVSSDSAVAPNNGVRRRRALSKSI